MYQALARRSVACYNTHVEHERILITVRTYPTVSRAYMETVCTGGITDKAEWRRLVPVSLRYLDEVQQFRTFDVVEIDVRPGKDGRVETRSPHLPSLRVTGHLADWGARWEWVRPTICGSLADMISQGRTLGPVAVSKVTDFLAEPSAPDWTPEQKQKLKQAHLFEERKPLEKVPYNFRFRWRDSGGDDYNSLILSWEVLETYRQYRERYQDPIAVMREKWLNDLCGADRAVHFFMGNLAKRRNIFCVSGIFSPPKQVMHDGILF
jgi:hypothetical protein